MKQDGSNLVFVIGSPRSGTTWLQRVLAAHPKVQTGQESSFFLRYIQPLVHQWRSNEPSYVGARGELGLRCYLHDSQYQELLRDFSLGALMANFQIPEGGVFVEKTPSHALCVEEIHYVFPKARFIHIVRDPAETIDSILRAADGWGKDWAPRSYKEAAAMWISHTHAAVKGLKSLPPDLHRTVRYSVLVASGPAIVMKLFEFIGLPVGLEQATKYLEQNLPGSKTMVKIPLAGEALRTTGDHVREPEGFFGGGRKGRRSRMFAPYYAWKLSRIKSFARRELGMDF
jgi:hypothetical protein